MRHRPENFNPAEEGPEVTLVTPRFDADEARRAHPVVPLAAIPPRQPSRGPRRFWQTALPAIALLAVAALGGALATYFMQSPRAERVEEQPLAAPVQTAEAPPPRPPAPAAAEAPRGEAPVARPATREARTRRARAVPVTVGPAPEGDEDGDDAEARGKAAEKRREREDEVEKEMRKQMDKALKRAKGKAPRLVDVLTSP